MARLYTSDMTKNYSTSGKGKGKDKGSAGDEAKSSDHDTTGTHKTGEVDVSSLYPIAASYCCIISLFPQWPGITITSTTTTTNNTIIDCLGCAGRNTICCIQNDLILCKRSLNEHSYCLCLKLEFECIPCQTCILSRTQLCCVDTRIAIPPESQQVAPVANLCGLSCYPKCSCCSKLDALQDE